MQSLRHRESSQVYGWDTAQRPGYPVLADIREFIIVTWVANGNGATRECPSRRACRAMRLSVIAEIPRRRSSRPVALAVSAAAIIAPRPGARLAPTAGQDHGQRPRHLCPG